MGGGGGRDGVQFWFLVANGAKKKKKKNKVAMTGGNVHNEYAAIPTDGGKRKVDQQGNEGRGEAVKLKATLGLVQGCTVIVGCVIGSGIFVAPGGVLLQVGSVNLSLVVWVVSGIFSMIGAYCYAELGCMIRKPGGDYAYILETFGPFVGFIRLWAECIVVRPCTVTIVALTFSTYAVKPFFPECDPPDESVRMLAVICICECRRSIRKKTLIIIFSIGLLNKMFNDMVN